MNDLVKHLGLFFTYEMDIRSITPDEVKKLGREANYMRHVLIQLTNVPATDRWKYRHQHLYNSYYIYDKTIYA